MTITRRGLMGGMAAGVACAGWTGAAWAAGAYRWPLGVQLWSVNPELDADLDGTLKALARLGYREVELAGLHGRSPAAFRQALASAGLRGVSAHYAMGDLLADPEGCIAAAKGVGAEWLVCSSPKPDGPVPAGDWIAGIRQAMTLSAWHTNAAALNRLGRMAKAAGLGFGYHNHPIEFARYDGQRGWDVLLAETDPNLVKLELDVSWAVAGGEDPVALLRRHPARFRLLHVKGLRKAPPRGTYGDDFATGPVGKGDVIAWAPVFAAARQAGVVHAFVEQEPPHTQPILTSLAACRNYLQHL